MTRTLDDQHGILHRDFDAVAVHARQVGAKDEFILVLINIDRWPIGADKCSRLFDGQWFKRALKTAGQRAHVAHRVPTGHRHGVAPCV